MCLPLNQSLWPGKSNKLISLNSVVCSYIAAGNVPFGIHVILFHQNHVDSKWKLEATGKRGIDTLEITNTCSVLSFILADGCQQKSTICNAQMKICDLQCLQASYYINYSPALIYHSLLISSVYQLDQIYLFTKISKTHSN